MVKQWLATGGPSAAPTFEAGASQTASSSGIQIFRADGTFMELSEDEADDSKSDETRDQALNLTTAFDASIWPAVVGKVDATATDLRDAVANATQDLATDAAAQVPTEAFVIQDATEAAATQYPTDATDQTAAETATTTGQSEIDDVPDG